MVLSCATNCSKINHTKAEAKAPQTMVGNNTTTSSFMKIQDDFLQDWLSRIHTPNIEGQNQVFLSFWISNLGSTIGEAYIVLLWI